MKTTDQLKEELQLGAYTSTLSHIYQCEPDETEFYAEYLCDLIDGFVDLYGSSKTPLLFSSPGQIEISGNHTDQQNGCVLLAAIQKDLVAAATKNSEGLIHVHWPDSEVPAVEVNNLAVNNQEYGKTESIIRGVVSRITEMGFKVGGLNIYLNSTIPKGFGLGSLAAFELLLVQIINHIYCKDSLDAMQCAQIAHYAQIHYYGKPGNLMNQIVASVGGLVGIDFEISKEPIVDRLEYNIIDAQHVICIIDSGAAHQDLALEYTAISREMHMVAEYFGREFLREVDEKAFLRELGALRKNGVADRAILRAIHFYRENQRAQAEFSALSDNDIDTFLDFVRQSCLSSYMFLQNVFSSTTPQQQNFALTLALCDELLGGKGAYRVHGAGFAGTIEAFVPLIMLENFQEGIEALLGENKCQVLLIRAKGACLIPLE